MLASFGRSWHSHIPLGLLFNFQGTVRRSFTYSHRESSNAPPKREKYLRIKNSLHSFGQRVPKCTPISGLFLKNFFEKKFTLHLFGITKPNDTLFFRKTENIFCPVKGWFVFTYRRKSLFTYSHREGVNSNPVSKNILLFVKTSSLIPTERNQMHTLNLKKFYPFTYLELGSRNATCFHKKFEKYFVRLWDSLFYLPKKSFHLFGIWAPKRNLFFRKNRKFFLKKLFISKTSPHLFPLGEGIWG